MPVVYDGVKFNAKFGDLIMDVKPAYKPGEMVKAIFRAGECYELQWGALWKVCWSSEKLIRLHRSSRSPAKLELGREDLPDGRAVRRKAGQLASDRHRRQLGDQVRLAANRPGVRRVAGLDLLGDTVGRAAGHLPNSPFRRQ